MDVKDIGLKCQCKHYFGTRLPVGRWQTMTQISQTLYKYVSGDSKS